MVKVGCDDCRGCSACCRGMGDSIVLDPMDLYRLERKLGKTMEEILTAGYISLRVVDGVILPHLKMTEQSDQCSFLMMRAGAAFTMRGRASAGCFRWDGCMRTERFPIFFRSANVRRRIRQKSKSAAGSTRRSSESMKRLRTNGIII